MESVVNKTRPLTVRTRPIELQGPSLGRLLISPGAGMQDALRLHDQGGLVAFRDGILARARCPRDLGDDRNAMEHGDAVDADRLALLSEQELRVLLAQWLASGGPSPFGPNQADACLAHDAERRWKILLEKLVEQAEASRQSAREAWESVAFGARDVRQRIADDRRRLFGSIPDFERDWQENLRAFLRPSTAELASVTCRAAQDIVDELLQKELAPWHQVRHTAEEEQRAFIEECLAPLRIMAPDPLDTQDITTTIVLDPPLPLPRVSPLHEQLAPVVDQLSAEVRASGETVAGAMARLEQQHLALASESRTTIAQVRTEMRASSRRMVWIAVVSVVVAVVAAAFTAVEALERWKLITPVPATAPPADFRPPATRPPTARLTQAEEAQSG